jgi:plastocyanin
MVRTMVARLGMLAAAVLLVGACSSSDDAGPAPAAGCRSAEGGRVTIVAADVAWDTDCLETPAGQPLTIVIDNRDDGVNHNLHLTDAPGTPKTELEAGPVTQELAVSLEAGDYSFVCDIHPNMVGTLEVRDANPGAEPPGEG